MMHMGGNYDAHGGYYEYHGGVQYHGGGGESSLSSLQ